MSTTKITMHFTFKVGQGIVHVEEPFDGNVMEMFAFLDEAVQDRLFIFGSKREAYPVSGLQMIWWEEK